MVFLYFQEMGAFGEKILFVKNKIYGGKVIQKLLKNLVPVNKAGSNKLLVKLKITLQNILNFISI